MAKSRKLADDARVVVADLDDHGCGLAEHDGFKVRVWSALPGETATVRVIKRRRTRLEVVAQTIAESHADRVSPECPMAARCGGCALQHLRPAAQRDFKRQRLARLFDAAGAPQPERWLADVVGPTRGYRRKARLGVRNVPGKGGVLVGFRERGTGWVADLQACRVLAPQIGERLMALRALIGGLDAPSAVPQLEIAVGDDAAAIIVRHLEPLSDADLELLCGVAEDQGWHLYLQPGGPTTVHRIWPLSGPERLHYQLPEQGLVMAFHPLDFTQVNPAINRLMIAQALDLLAPQAEDRVLDLFCGLGNFTLPLAQRCAQVTGLEGSADLVARAAENAAANGITNAAFAVADLYADQFDPAQLPACDRVLLDPPRSGAEAICTGIDTLRPTRIVYVSCNPETLARDAARLAASRYRMTAAGILDMFPHTAHVESMAVFDRV